jgi:microcompartment protein CcmK/EutM
MILGKVTGSVWGTKEARLLDGMKLLQVRPVLLDGQHEEVGADLPTPSLSKTIIVAADDLGAGVGEYVLVGHGSRVRDLTIGAAMPVKDVILAIVDKAMIDSTLLKHS